MPDYDAIRTVLPGALATPMEARTGAKNRDKYRGCLLGGAAGDALGYAVEFLEEPEIFGKFGPKGITRYALHKGKARISDDTQMTLFTANGLLNAVANGLSPDAYPRCIAKAYQQWYKTQEKAFPGAVSQSDCWLMTQPLLYAARAPGITCMSAIEAGCWGSPEDPINNSKGCGGVMRVAPVGLCFPQGEPAPLAVDMLGADAAALTHGNPLGYIPAAMLVHIIRLVANSDTVTLKEAVRDSQIALETIFGGEPHLEEFQSLIDLAVELAEQDGEDLDAIHALGTGWVGDEALAIAVYCALKYAHDFDRALIAAVNHGGDSDSTGAITGNILGAYLGLSGIPQKYRQDLELAEVILEIADHLYDSSTPGETAWRKKYRCR